mmetsp:Transcript_8168/g.20847  ORF Transcript_8168/g.20847 Transcript_8168/m.20847 type:complete len:265 (-) Transcript_8168:792-1586(-)
MSCTSGYSATAAGAAWAIVLAMEAVIIALRHSLRALLRPPASSSSTATGWLAASRRGVAPPLMGGVMPYATFSCTSGEVRPLAAADRKPSVPSSLVSPSLAASDTPVLDASRALAALAVAVRMVVTAAEALETRRVMAPAWSSAAGRAAGIAAASCSASSADCSFILASIMRAMLSASSARSCLYCFSPSASPPPPLSSLSGTRRCSQRGTKCGRRMTRLPSTSSISSSSPARSRSAMTLMFSFTFSVVSLMSAMSALSSSTAW